MLQLSKWDLDIETSDEDQYKDLVRAVRRTDQRFKLLFVSCIPSKGEEIRHDLMSDIPAKKYELLDIKESIDNLYEAINNIPNLEKLDVLFIRGLEYSIFEYEDQEFGDISKRSQCKVYAGSWAGAPPVLARLNMQRELFRDRFSHICFVFLLPHFAIDYFIRRAPDFYDWKSGIYRFATDTEDLQMQLDKVSTSVEYRKYAQMSSEEKLVETRKIRSYLDEVQEIDRRWNLLSQLGLIDAACDRYSLAINAFDSALKINPDDAKSFYWRGVALEHLGRYEESLDSFNHAIKIDKDYHEAWFNLGIVQDILSKHEEAIESYDKAPTLKPDEQAWYRRGIALTDLGRYKAANDSYDRAIELKSEDYKIWHGKGFTLYKWGLYPEALKAYDEAIQRKWDHYPSLFDRGSIYFHLEDYDKALSEWQSAFDIIKEVKASDTSDLIQAFLYQELLPKFQQPTVRDILPQLLTIYTTAQVLPELTVALTRNIKAIQSPIISDYTAAEWLKMWKELGKPHPELALAPRMLEAGIKYKQNPTDDRLFLSLPQELRPLLREALGLEE